MSKLLYNGVELPKVPAHDADATVEVISAVLPAALSMYAQSPYILVIGKGTLWQGGKCYVRGVSAVYRLSGDAWVWHYGSGTVSTQDIVAANYFEAIWTNTDIPTADGAGIYLAASAPVDPNAPDEPEPEEPPVEPNVDVAAIYRRGWMDGFLSGINIRGILRRRKVEEPQPVTAYLYGTPSPTIVTYNGVELPELPEWDKTKYPYAVIISHNSTNYYFFTCTDPMYIVKESSGTYLEAENSQNLPNNANFWLLKDGVWDSRGGYNLRLGVIDASGNPFYTPVWSNTDIPNLDTNTVYLAASEPVYSQVGGNIALADGEGYVLYNGAVLPPLPEWDKTAYPYAVIVYSGPVSLYNLYFYVNPPSLSYGWWDSGSNSLVQAPSAPYIMYRLPESGSEWQGDGKPITYNAGIVTPITPDGVTVENGAYKFVWTNTDIYAENDTEFGELAGTLFYASSDPIPLASSEPVAAVYGGTKLPVLPDTENAYKYITVKNGVYYFAAQTTEALVNDGGTINMLSGERWKLADGSWQTLSSYPSFTTPVWTNTDLYQNESAGSGLVLAASEPVPVYE